MLGLPSLPPLLYEVDQKEALHKFHRDLPDTRIWDYNGLLPGPTFRVYQVTQATHREVQAQPVLVCFHNHLPKDHTGCGVPIHMKVVLRMKILSYKIYLSILSYRLI